MAISDKALVKYCLRLKSLNDKSDTEKLDQLNELINQDLDFASLDPQDKQKLFEIFVLYNPQVSLRSYQLYYNYRTTKSWHYSRRRYYTSSFDLFFPVYYQPIIICPGGGCNHSSSKSNETAGEVILIILAMALVLCALVLTVKTVLEISNNLESIYYDEGRERAIFNLVAIGAIFGGSAYVAATFLFASLIATNPYSLVAFVAAASTIIFSYLVFWAVDSIADKTMPAELANPKTPYNTYTISSSDEYFLNEKGYDPVLARAAIIFINSEIKTPTKLMLWADKDPDDRKRLELIRDIRQGNVSEIDGHGLKNFNLKKDATIQVTRSSDLSEHIPVAKAEFEDVPLATVVDYYCPFTVAPSAPPMENVKNGNSLF